MDKQTLSNYGWVIITVLVLAVMLALATPFGTYVKEGAKSTLTGLFESSENALNTGLSEAGVSINKAEFGGAPTVGNTTEITCCEMPDIITYVDDTKCNNCNNIVYGSNIHSGIIPEGGKYYYYDNEKICEYCSMSFIECLNGGCEYLYWCESQLLAQAGDAFPKVQIGDQYRYGDYIYDFVIPTASTSAFHGWGYQSVDSWFVRVSDRTKTSYGEIITEINNKPITEMYGTFSDCTNLTSVPEIPNTVVVLTECFAGCKSLSNVDIVIKNINTMQGAFVGCESLSGNITFIDSKPIDYTYCFYIIDFAKQQITLKGEVDYLDEIGNTGDNYCEKCNGYCYE